jgi:hypothetical protein
MQSSPLQLDSVTASLVENLYSEQRTFCVMFLHLLQTHCVLLLLLLLFVV